MPTYILYNKMFSGAIFIYPANPLWCQHWFYHYIKAKTELRGKVVFYTVVEGIPKPQLIPEWVRKDIEFIACSHYVKTRLEKVGLRVRDVVHHGYLEAELNGLDELVEKYRRLLLEQFKDKVLFGYVGDIGFRKGVDKLLTAINKLSEKRKDFQVLFITKKDILRQIEKIPCTTLVSEMGFRSHSEIMAFYKSIDFLLFPTLSEGFGLPLLEANAVGTPAIINKLPPFEEYADMKANLVLKSQQHKIVDVGEGLYFDIYDYDVNELVALIDQAIDIKKNYPSQYDDMKVKVQERVKGMKSEVLYRKLIEFVEIENK